MAKRIVTNRQGNGVTVHLNATHTIVVAGESSDLDNDRTNNNETVTGASITQVAWGSGGSGAGVPHWTIARNGEIVLVLDSTSYLDFAGTGAAINLDNTADLVCTLVNATSGFLMIELQKQGNIQRNEYLVG